MQVNKVNTSLLEYISTIIPKENLFVEEPMNQRTTFRTGGNAEILIEVETEEQLKQLIIFLNKIEEEYHIIGNGSNLLIGDRGIRGAILQIGSRMSKLEVYGTTIVAGAGVLLSQLAAFAAKNKLSGLEFASGIPGTLGGAVVMNAGAYGGEMCQVVTKVKVMTYEGEILELDHETMEFQYRNSVIRNKKFVVLEVEMSLELGDQKEILAKMSELSSARKEKQPLEFPSAGSTFKRPEGHFSGKLIMEAGLKGLQIGGAQVSEKHCGFVINRDHATSADILEVIRTVQDRVFENAGVKLEMEVICLGDF